MRDLHIQATAFVDANPKMAGAIAAIVQERRTGSPVGLTARQHELLEFITRYIRAHHGVCPSYTEMMDALGLRSKSGVNRLIEGLVERGHVRKALGKTRSLVLVGDPHGQA